MPHCNGLWLGSQNPLGHGLRLTVLSWCHEAAKIILLRLQVCNDSYVDSHQKDCYSRGAGVLILLVQSLRKLTCVADSVLPSVCPEQEKVPGNSEKAPSGEPVENLPEQRRSWKSYARQFSNILKTFSVGLGIFAAVVIVLSLQNAFTQQIIAPEVWVPI